jgi:hypothetical protein
VDEGKSNSWPCTPLPFSHDSELVTLANEMAIKLCPNGQKSDLSKEKKG